MNYQSLFRSAGLCAVAMLFGCTQKLASTPNAEGPQGVFQVASGHDTSLNEYVIDPPDEILIKAPNIKEIENVKQVVRADGRISLNLLGEVQVAKKTPAQVQKMLQELAGKYYNNPDIKIEVVANSKFYSVVGRGVTTGGKKAYTGNDTLVKALAESGMNENAWPQQVLLVRPGRNGQEPARAVVDFKNITENGVMAQNYVLHEGDIVNVRDSPLSSFNFKFTQVLGPVSGASSVRAATGR
jgi:polysaccharide export outer membrane protein